MLFFLGLIFSAHGFEILSQIGESCAKNPVFVLSNFTVTPYPITIYSPYVIFMNGTFSDSETVKYIYIGTKYSINPWNYVSQDVNESYKKHSTANFSVTMQSFTAKGGYTVQTTLHRTNHDILSCWQFDFIIN